MTPITEYFTTFFTTLDRRQKFLILVAVDVVLVPLSLALMVLATGPAVYSAFALKPLSFAYLAAIMSLAGGVFSIVVGLPWIKLNAYEQRGIQRTATYAVCVGSVGYGAGCVLFDSRIELRDMAIFVMILLISAVIVRLSMRNLLIWFYRHSRLRQRVLIYGAGQTGVQLATALQTDHAIVPVAFIDDNKTLQKITVAGLPVYAPAHLDVLIKGNYFDRVVLAIPSLSRPEQARLVRRLETLGCVVSALPSFAALVGKGDLVSGIQPVNPSEFLGRDGFDCDFQKLAAIYKGSTVMVTGAGGSIGAELTRQILLCRPAKIILFEISEFALYQITNELLDLGAVEQNIEIVPVLGSVTDNLAVRRAIVSSGVDIILHAAAYKHVPLVEKNRLAGLQNNVIGTKVIAEAARDCGVGHFILISTDKAVHPTNVMGASKRLAELLVQDLATRCDVTRFGIVRFGNVLGSSGSVVPLFEEQISRGGPVTLTHEDVSRYFMTVSEAARLVLMAGNFIRDAKEYADAPLDGRGNVFLLDMGAPVPIKRLARQMIEAAGYSVCDADNPQGDIEICVTGLRAGEKLHEELAMRDHVQWPTAHHKIRRIEEEGCLSQIEAATALRDLSRAIAAGDDAAALDVIDRWVGPYYQQNIGRRVPEGAELADWAALRS